MRLGELAGYTHEAGLPRHQADGDRRVSVGLRDDVTRRNTRSFRSLRCFRVCREHYWGRVAGPRLEGLPLPLAAWHVRRLRLLGSPPVRRAQQTGETASQPASDTFPSLARANVCSCLDQSQETPLWRRPATDQRRLNEALLNRATPSAGRPLCPRKHDYLLLQQISEGFRCQQISIHQRGSSPNQ